MRVYIITLIPVEPFVTSYQNQIKGSIHRLILNQSIDKWFEGAFEWLIAWRVKLKFIRLLTRKSSNQGAFLSAIIANFPQSKILIPVANGSTDFMSDYLLNIRQQYPIDLSHRASSHALQSSTSDPMCCQNIHDHGWVTVNDITH